MRLFAGTRQRGGGSTFVDATISFVMYFDYSRFGQPLYQNGTAYRSNHNVAQLLTLRFPWADGARRRLRQNGLRGDTLPHPILHELTLTDCVAVDADNQDYFGLR